MDRPSFTGGANFWSEYHNVEKTGLVDLSCKILGGATESAHAYCNYLWE
jgi:hypothetical protein